MPERTWTCQRWAENEQCRHVNPKRFQKCEACGKRRAPSSKPSHRTIMAVAYEHWVTVFGSRCMLCGAKASKDRRLDREHAHSGAGIARGILCHGCNRRLWRGVTLDQARRLVAYLERAEAQGDADTARLWELHEEAERRS